MKNKIIFLFCNCLFVGVIPSVFIWIFGLASVQKSMMTSLAKTGTLDPQFMNDWFFMPRTAFMVFWSFFIGILAIFYKRIVKILFEDM